MKFIYLISFIFISSNILAQDEDYLNLGSPSAQSPLSVFTNQISEEEEQNYLLEKKSYGNPDDLYENPISLSKLEFKNLEHINTSNSCSDYKMSDKSINSVFGSLLEEEPYLCFYQNQLYKINFKLFAEEKNKGELLKNLTKRYGKPNKHKYEIDDKDVKSYSWEGYKLDIQLVTFQNKGMTEQLMIVEDKLISKIAEADKERKTLVKEARLYSDIESLFR
ncbi:hypothetical protein [Flexithrix dorotheae]|uniref:hypothetical protein n=1 Tax=Flexithrix dorotheae TaxID=70993 RepID=UPI00036B8C8E|nr:hypothetical protein [Flexithrix dorotheae]